MAAVIGPGGRLWWTTREAVDQLQVLDSRLRDWVRRSKAAGHVVGAGMDFCPACRARIGDRAAGFPHVDPPRRSGAIAVYLAEQLLEAEAYTGASHRGASRDVT